MSDLRTIRLGGELGEKFGREWHLHVEHVGEAVRAIEANFHGFRDHLARAEERGIGFVVTVADREVEEGELTLVSKGDILIMPALFGASSGVRIIAGVALIAAGVLLFPTCPMLGPALFGMGMSMVVGGVIEMLTPIPKMGGQGNDSSATKPSYVFSGPVQTSAQGLPVPIGGGTMLISGTIISAGISADDFGSGSTSTDPVLIDNAWG